MQLGLRGLGFLDLLIELLGELLVQLLTAIQTGLHFVGDTFQRTHLALYFAGLRLELGGQLRQCVIAGVTGQRRAGGDQHDQCERTQLGSTHRGVDAERVRAETNADYQDGQNSRDEILVLEHDAFLLGSENG